MNPCERFAEISSVRFLNIRSLEKEKPYSLIGAERFKTKYGISLVFTHKASSTDIMRAFLLKLFANIFSNVDIDAINDRTIKINPLAPELFFFLF